MLLKLRKKCVLLLVIIFCIVVVCTSVCLVFLLPRKPTKNRGDVCIPRTCLRKSDYSYGKTSDLSPVCIPTIHCPMLVRYREYKSICISRSCFTENKVDNSSAEKLCMPKMCVSLTGRAENLKSANLCLTEDCVRTASTVITTLDKDRDPCDDFFGFACGNFIHKENDLVGSRTFSTANLAESRVAVKIKGILEDENAKDSDALHKAKEVYRICMNEAYIEENALQELKNLLTSRRFGSWPSLDLKWNDCNLDLEWKMAILNAYGVDSIFRLVPEFKGINKTLFGSAYIAPPVVQGICDEEFEKDDGNLTAFALQVTKMHRSLMYRILSLLEAPENTTDSDLEDFFRFDAKYCSIIKPSRGLTFSYDVSKYTVQDLNALTPKVNWNRWHSIVFSELGLTHRMDKSPVYIYGIETSIVEIAELLHNTSARVLANYFSWKFILHHLGFMVPTLSRMAQDHWYLFPQKSDFLGAPWSPRWKQCAKYVAKMMPLAIIPAYYSRNFISGTHREVNILTEAIRHTFNETFRKTHHLKPEQKAKSIKKIGELKFRLPFPEKDKKFLDNYYSQIGKLPSSFLHVGLTLKRLHLKRMFEGVLKGTNISDIPYLVGLQDPFTSHEWSDFRRNLTMLSFAMFESTDFSVNQPRYLNFGSFGTAYAHMIAGGFDLASFTGESQDGHAPKNWTEWPSDVVHYVQKRSTCFKQFPHSEHESIYSAWSKTHAGVVDIAAENQAVYTAFKAYQSYVKSHRKEQEIPTVYSNEELFFIRYAQLWCSTNFMKSVHKHRVNEALRHLPEFSSIFHCTESSKMNPKAKCETLWTEDDAPLDYMSHVNMTDETRDATKDTTKPQK